MMLHSTAVFTPRDIGELLRSRILPRITGAVVAATRLVADDARANVSVMSGELQASIAESEPSDDGKQIRAEVSAGTNHCMFVEFGTGLAGMGTYPYPLPQKGVPITGSWIYDYKHQNWPGMTARPYLRPALDTVRGEVLREFEERL